MSSVLAVIFQTVLGIISSMNLVAYLFIIVCIIRHPALQVITNYFLFSTGVAHIIFQVTCLSLTFYAHDMCSISSPWAFIGWFLLSMDNVFWNTVLVAVETFLKVCHPFRYAQMMTDRKCFALIGFTWTVGTLVAMITLVKMMTYENRLGTRCPINVILVDNSGAFQVYLNITLVPSLLALTFCNVQVVRTARSQARRIAVLNINGALNEQQKVDQLQRKSTISFAVFAGTYLCGWVPLLILLNVAMSSSSTPSQVGVAVAYIIVGNATSIGPLVYILRQAGFARLRALYWQRLRVSLGLPQKLQQIHVQSLSKDIGVVNDVETLQSA